MTYRSKDVGQRGAVLLLLMVTVVILGLSAGIAGQAWRDTMQRAREAEMVWRGKQYVQAIESYYSVKHGPQQMLPAKLEFLVRDPRFPNVVRHLRKQYLDPMTNEDWELVTDPAERIIGVRSTSQLEPFRKDGFSAPLEKLNGKSAYSEWEFVFEIPKKTSKGKSSTVAPQPRS